MISLDEYVNGDNGCYVLPNVSILKTIKLASNTQYFNRHLSMFSMRYGIDVPLADRNGNVIPYQLVVEKKISGNSLPLWTLYSQRKGFPYYYYCKMGFINDTLYDYMKNKSS